ncbi:MAG: CbtA family protein [Actinomycetota bacterium]|nr:CbtA family protein [Actinomycetota bacterium]
MGFPTASAEVPASTAPPFGARLAHIAAAGLVAGALSGTWSPLITERAIEPALAIEEARSATGGGDAEEMFGRTTQVLGGLLGAVLAGLVLSLVIAVVFAGIRHRLPARTDFGRMVLLGAIGFAVLGLLPALKIPANPRRSTNRARSARGRRSTVPCWLPVSSSHCSCRRRSAFCAAVASASR